VIFYYMDASAWVKCYLQETGRAAASSACSCPEGHALRARYAICMLQTPVEQLRRLPHALVLKDMRCAHATRSACSRHRTFVTSDRKLKDAARASGLDVIDPEEQQLPISP